MEKKAIRTLKDNCPPIESVVMFSGGKDSLVVMDLARRAGIKNSVYIKSPLEFKQTIKYVESFPNVEIIGFNKNFFDLCRKLCIPSRRMKWCCTVYKLTPIAIYNRKNKIKYNIRGVRREESSNRKDYDEIGDKQFPWTTINPILDWTDKDIWRYIKKYNLPTNPLYQLVNRVGCWCCPFNSKKDWGAARDMMPNEFKQFKKLITEFSWNIDDEWRRYYIKGGWSGWAYKTELEPVATLINEEDLLKVEKKLNCVGCGSCIVFNKIRMGCIARNYTRKRKIAL